MHILSTFKDNGTQTKFDEFEGCKKPARAGADDNHGRSSRHVAIFHMGVFFILRLFVYIHSHLKIDIYGALSGIYTAPEHTDMLYGL